MRILTLSATLVVAFGIMACGQKKSAPESVAKAFNERFANAQNVKWDQEEKNEWEAEFKLDKMQYSATYDVKGNWMETEHKVNKNRLPDEILNALTQKYSTYKLKGAEVSETPENGFVYELAIETGGEDYEVVIDKTGKIIKVKEGDEDQD